MAKDLNAFINKASKDKGLAKKVNKAKSAEELRSIAADAGFELTDSDINSVSGGGLLPSFNFDNVRADVRASLINVNKTSLSQNATIQGGDNNTAAVTGTQTINQNRN